MNQGKFKFSWHYIALAGILLTSIILNFYKLGQEGYGNLYYSAAVKSMLQSWHNFFFNSFDSKGFITIDKPPVGFWFQTLSAYIFGFKGWSLFLPQALAGVLSVALLYHLVARVFGRGAGLMAALFLALTPIVVAADRTNEIDSLLMFTTLIATWAISKAVDRSSLKWLLLAAALVGLGFNIKMMEAFLVLPAFYVFYVISPRLSWTKKIVHLVCATVVLAVVSFSWSFIVDSTPPDQRPYVGSTQNNSMVELAIGYNGINRLVGQQRGVGGFSGMRPQQNHRAGGQGDAGGEHRGADANYQSSMGPHGNGHGSNLNATMQHNVRGAFNGGGQTGRPGLLRLFTTPQLAGQLSWLLPGVLFSALSLLWGIRLREPLDRKRQTAIFWTVWVLTMFIFFSVANRFSSYYMVMLAPGIAALAAAGFKEMWNQWHASATGKAWLLPPALVCTAGFAISVVWKYPGLGTMVSLVIGVLALIALISMLAVRKENGTGKKGITALAVSASILSLILAPAVWAVTPVQYGGSVSKPFAGPELKMQKERDGMVSNPKLESYLKANYRQGTYFLATLNAMSAAPIMIDTNLPVMAMGGFMGADPVLTVEKLQKLAKDGQVRYFLLQGQGDSFGNRQTAVANWIRTNCRIVPADKWMEPQSRKASGQGWMGFGHSSETLYEYVQK
ncbi:glycosyltransferase family 39 protein [Aneurinibacillus sp. Ricciae_BoGa-3]|uniref:glycosyltransferase family 39 protein n=1 Tax=Aneurinibacillus sp. Ricciae_BoGa-3 TaxID=3022697 RepID=UPI002340FA1E|nr:glycosyltransferase family 39 protein [Aneurinibacillus sp. Ricciae_BoGa-3]WCK55634.1 glycosyltransferase family 39 protein [Aneurinibacillus sp. Ricciae_BoGa-3]